MRRYICADEVVPHGIRMEMISGWTDGLLVLAFVEMECALGYATPGDSILLCCIMEVLGI